MTHIQIYGNIQNVLYCISASIVAIIFRFADACDSECKGEEGRQSDRERQRV